MHAYPSSWSEQIDNELRADAPVAPLLSSARDVVVFRRLMDSRSAAPPERRVKTSESELGPRGVRVRIYTPDDVAFTTPVVYLHAGGFVAGSIQAADSWVHDLSTALQAAVVSVEYALAPERPYPAAVDDVVSIVRLLSDRTGEAIVVVGDSAGAGIGVGAALRLRDDNSSAVGFLSLSNPALDDRLISRSATCYVDTPLWNRASAEAGWTHYLRGSARPGSADVPAHAAPARAVDLVGMPPASVTVSHLDPLRDEGIAFAQALLSAGVPTELHMFPGTFHGSRTMAHAEVSRSMAHLCVRSIRRALTPVSPA